MKSAKAEGLVLRAAIYARKSTDEKDRDVSEKSVERQIARATAYAERKGWKVDPAHVYVDDGISGAEYVNRPGFARMIAALPRKGRPPFDVLIMSEPSRFGRDMRRNAYYMGDVLDSGVRIFYYLTDDEEKAETPEEQFILMAKGYAAESERMRASQRVRDKLELKAKAGHVTGGEVYGYQRTRKDGHTEYGIDLEQAEIVRRIFKMYAAGYGPRSIAKTLNGDPKYATLSRRFFNGERPPKPIVGKRGTGSWAPTAVRDILRNERYAGVLVYGRTTKLYRKGGRRREKQTDQNRIVRIERHELRIVPAGLWDAVQRRISAERHAYLKSTNGQAHGRPETGRDSRYLLSGLIRCGGCGAAMVVSSQPHGSGEKRKLVTCFVCSYRSNRGTTACQNGLRPREEALTREVLAGIAGVLKPDLLRAAVRRALEKRGARKAELSPEHKRRAVAKAEAERQRLVNAIRMGGELEALVDALRDCEGRLTALRRDLALAERPTMVDELSDKRMERRLLELAEGWQTWILKHPTLARQALRAMLVGPIKLDPERDGYRLKGVTRLGALFEQGGPANRVEMASPRGFEPRLPP